MIGGSEETEQRPSEERRRQTASKGGQPDRAAPPDDCLAVERAKRDQVERRQKQVDDDPEPAEHAKQSAVQRNRTEIQGDEDDGQHEVHHRPSDGDVTVFAFAEVALMMDRAGRGEDEAQHRAHHRQEEHAVVRTELRDLAVVDGDDLVSEFVEQESDASGQQADSEQDDHARPERDEVRPATSEEDGEGDPQREPRDQQVTEFAGAELVVADTVGRAHWWSLM